jgi:hypothetical protein
MDMSMIMKCTTANCAYNAGGICHTLAITVGPHAECNTFVHASARGGFKDIKGGIGACLAADCKFNEKLECKASSVNVAGHEKHADCETFVKKA